ncbi:MAG TPA: hypothetical protein VKB34_18630 [Povalibacter sp.]|nr:hypothetical protein [Povalibacter sp.]
MTSSATNTEQLRARLRQNGPVWLAHCSLGERSDIEIEVTGSGAGPSIAHVEYAAECVAGLAQLLPDLEAALNAVEESHPLFPPRRSRRWYLEGLSFTAPDSRRGEALFTLDEPGYDYLYVLYSVEIVAGRAGQAHADTR